MTPAELKAHVDATGSYFFTRGSMKFFGDTMRNYGVSRKPVFVKTRHGEEVECWELYRKRPVKHGLRDSTYFCVKTFKIIHKAFE